jgi:hypothetical protein
VIARESRRQQRKAQPFFHERFRYSDEQAIPRGYWVFAEPCRAFIWLFAARHPHLNRFFRPLIKNLFRASPEAGKRTIRLIDHHTLVVCGY